MRTNFVLLIIVSFFALLLGACESHEQTADDAFERVKEEKIESAMVEKFEIIDTGIINKEIVIESNKPKIVRKKENTDAWCKFKIEIENRIVENENKIKEIKSTPYVNNKLLKKVTRLEKDNYDLRNEINKCEMEAKVVMENFKTKMNKEINDIDAELKDIAINNKK